MRCPGVSDGAFPSSAWHLRRRGVRAIPGAGGGRASPAARRGACLAGARWATLWSATRNCHVPFGPGALDSPRGVAALGDALFIAAAGRHQVWRFDLGGRTLAPRAAAARHSSTPSRSAPAPRRGGARHRDGRLYVAGAESSAVRSVPLGGGRVRTLCSPGREPGCSARWDSSGSRGDRPARTPANARSCGSTRPPPRAGRPARAARAAGRRNMAERAAVPRRSSRSEEERHRRRAVPLLSANPRPFPGRRPGGGAPTTRQPRPGSWR